MQLINYAGTIAANELASVLTKQAGEQEAAKAKQAAEAAKLAMEQSQMKATERANYLNATMTADARTAQAQVAQQTAVAMETKMYATSFAQATVTQQAFIVNQQNTAIAGEATAKVQPQHDMWTQQAIQVVQTVQAGEAKDVDLAVQRTTAVNMMRAWGPWAILAALAYVGGRGFQTYVRTRTHGRDEHGRKQTLHRELPDGGVVFVEPEMLETGIVKVTNDGDVIRYAPMDKDEQSKINRGRSIAEIVSQLPIPYAKAGQNLLNKFSGAQISQPGRVNIHGDGRFGPAIEEADMQLLEEEV
jgi:ABC-type uncharacterized transport system involved in gliding motility auxiliary subunit